jgi:hypothetical protein
MQTANVRLNTVMLIVLGMKYPYAYEPCKSFNLPLNQDTAYRLAAR